MPLKHGVVIREETISPPSVRTVDASTPLVMGTAPDVDVKGIFGDGTGIKYNTPFLLTSRTDANADDLGESGTLPRALDSIFAQGNFKVVMVIVEESGDVPAAAEVSLAVQKFNTTTDETVLDALTGADVHWAIVHDNGNRYLAFKNLAAADKTKFQALTAGRVVEVYASGGNSVLHSYTIQDAYDATNDRIQVENGASTSTLTSGTDYDLKVGAVAAVNGEVQTRFNAQGDPSELTGIYTALAAESVLGVKPRLLCAPGMDTGSRPEGAANGLAAAMVIVADRLRAMAIIDGPNTTHEDVITYIDDFDTPRAIVVDPSALISTENGVEEQALSGFAAGVIARNDYDNGWWSSPSNKPIRGIVGLARPIDSGNANSRAQIMLDNGIWTVVNDASGYQFWGTDTPATSNPEYSFPNVQRTADILADSLEQGHRWAVAKGITKNYLSSVEQSVNDFLRSLVAKDAISGGLCYADAALNIDANVAKGEAYFNMEWTPVYPANSVVITMQLTTKHLNLS